MRNQCCTLLVDGHAHVSNFRRLLLASRPDLANGPPHAVQNKCISLWLALWPSAMTSTTARVPSQLPRRLRTGQQRMSRSRRPLAGEVQALKGICKCHSGTFQHVWRQNFEQREFKPTFIGSLNGAGADPTIRQPVLLIPAEERPAVLHVPTTCHASWDSSKLNTVSMECMHGGMNIIISCHKLNRRQHHP